MFHNVERAKQLISFDGMEYENASLSDIDFCMEYRNKLWVIGEVKTGHTEVPKGQRYFLQRFVEMAKDGGRRAIAIICEHNVLDCRQVVQLRDCMVREYYTTETGRWAFPRKPYYVESMIKEYIEIIEGGNNCNGQVASGVQETR